MEKHEFESRVVACRDRYYRIAKAILVHEADCDDAMQEALVKAWMNLSRLRSQEYFETWLCRILINECKQLLRRHGRRPEAALSDTFPAQSPPDLGLWEALYQIDLPYRVPLLLHHAEKYSIKDIAGILQLPISTVKWRIHHGKALLARQLEKEATL